MLKKFLFSLFFFWGLLGLVTPVSAQNLDLIEEAQLLGYPVTEEQQPAAFALIDAATGDILWQENIDLIRDPASMTKLMTVYLIYEAMANSGATEKDTITATATDQAISQIYAISNNKIVSGVAYPIGDLLTATLVKSSNAAVYMLTNHFYPGSDSAFVDQMNIKAKELGMTNTKFYNAAGAAASAYENYYLPDRYESDKANQTTARDLGILTYHLLKEFPQVVEHTKNYEVTIMAGTDYEEEFQSYVESLPGGSHALDGVNGLKTGSSPSAQFNVVTTAKRQGKELIAIVLGVGNWYEGDVGNARDSFVNTLLLKGFSASNQLTRSPLVKDNKVTSQNNQPRWYQLERGIAKTHLMWLLLATLGTVGFVYLSKKTN